MTTPQSRVVSAVISLIVGAIVDGTLAGLVEVVSTKNSFSTAVQVMKAQVK